MGTIGTFGSFTRARLAIYASQTGLSVTGNNIANINTEGYTRQKLDQESFRTGGSDRYHSTYGIRVGNGVLTTGVSQLRDPYLDIRYRSQMSNVGFMDAKLGGLENIQAVLDEVGDGDEAFGIIEAQLSTLYDALQQLTDQTGHEIYDGSVRAAAEALCKQFNAYASSLDEVYKNAVTSFEQDVTSINTILTNIQELNILIRKNELHGDNALEMRDERNLLIDQLSEYMKIDVIYTDEEIGAGQTVEKLTIRLGDANPDRNETTDSSILIDGAYATQLSIDQVPQPNPKYDDTQAIGPDNLPFLDDKGKPVENAADAKMVNNPNFNMTLSELRDPNGRLYYSVQKMEERLIISDPADPNYDKQAHDNAIAGLATTIDNPDLSGGKIITTYRAESRSVLLENTDDTKINPDTGLPFKYLKADGTTGTDNYKEAGRIPVTTYYATDYYRTPSQAVQLDDNDLYGALQAQRELLTEAGEFSTQKTITDVDENAATKRGIPYYQHALDLLANQIATAFNKQNQGFMTDEHGNYVKITPNGDGTDTVEPVTVTYTDANNVEQTYTLNKYSKWDEVPAELKAAGGAFANYESFEDYLAADNDGDGELNGTFVGCNLFSVRGDLNDTVDEYGNGINASNISISADWASGPQIITTFIRPSNLEEATTDSSNVLQMVSLFTEKMDYDPDTLVEDATDTPMFNGTFQEMWVNIGSVLGNDMDVTTTMLDNYYASSVSLDTSRDSVSGVDLNDEAMNLMQYTRSYQAACRLMTTIDSLLDKLINGTGTTI